MSQNLASTALENAKLKEIGGGLAGALAQKEMSNAQLLQNEAMLAAHVQAKNLENAKLKAQEQGLTDALLQKQTEAQRHKEAQVLLAVKLS